MIYTNSSCQTGYTVIIFSSTETASFNSIQVYADKNVCAFRDSKYLDVFRKLIICVKNMSNDTLNWDIFFARFISATFSP